MSLIPSEVSNEDDLLYYVNGKWTLGEFGKICGISTFKISPDIDLLNINERTQTVTGYEFKLLTYHRGWKQVNLTPLYSGIGQAFSYFQFGVEKSFLLLGISKAIPKSSLSSTMDIIDGVVTVFERLRTFVKETLETKKDIDVAHLPSRISIYEPFGIDCFGIKVWNEHDDILMTKLKADENFPVYLDQNLVHRKNCLIRKEFKFKYKK